MAEFASSLPQWAWEGGAEKMQPSYGFANMAGTEQCQILLGD